MAKRRTRRKSAAQPQKKEVYSGLFTAGVIFLLFSLMLGGTTFLVLGVIFTVIGLANKDKWDKNACKFDRKTIVKAVIVGLIVAAAIMLLRRFF